jgi:2-iminobutanoate/2-iminopropanoate deaminase
MGKRQVIEGEGLVRHRNPIPTAVRIGQFVFSSAIGGQDPATGATPADPAEQVAQAFRNLRAVLDAAGATPADVAKLTVYLRDLAHREYVNQHWLAWFPDPHDRPVRHTLQVDLQPPTLVQLEFIAIV